MKHANILLYAFLTVLFTTCSDLTVKPDFSKSFIKYYGGTNTALDGSKDSKVDIVSDMQLTSDGGYILVGSSNSFTVSMDMYVVKTDKMGNMQWQRNYGDIGADSGRAIVQTSGGYLIVGTHGDPNTNISSMWVVKINENGDTLWTKAYNEPKKRNAFGTSIGVGLDNNSFVIGGAIRDSSSKGIDYKAYVRRINADDQQKGKITLSPQPYGINSFDNIPNSIFESKIGTSSGVVFSSTSGSTEGGTSPYYGRFNEFGNIRGFIGKTDASINERDLVNSEKAIKTSDGGYLITGLSINDEGKEKGYLLKLLGDEPPTKVWFNNSYGGLLKNTAAYAAAETNDGGYVMVGGIFVGENSKSGGSADVYIVKTGSDGVLQWEKSYGGPNLDYATAVKQTADGGYIIAASLVITSSEPKRVIALIKVDADGNLNNK